MGANLHPGLQSSPPPPLPPDLTSQSTFTKTAASDVWLSIWKASFFTPMLYFGHSVSDSLFLSCLLFLKQTSKTLRSLSLTAFTYFRVTFFFFPSDLGNHCGEFKHLRLYLLIRLHLNVWNPFSIFALCSYLLPSWGNGQEIAIYVFHFLICFPFPYRHTCWETHQAFIPHTRLPAFHFLSTKWTTAGGIGKHSLVWLLLLKDQNSKEKNNKHTHTKTPKPPKHKMTIKQQKNPWWKTNECGNTFQKFGKW